MLLQIYPKQYKAAEQRKSESNKLLDPVREEIEYNSRKS